MPDESLPHFSRLLAFELDAAQLRMFDEVTRVESDYNSRGLFQSSARMVQTAKTLMAWLELYRRYIFEKLTSYIQPRLSSLTEADRVALAGAALNALDAAFKGAKNHYATRSQFNPHLIGPLAMIEEAGARERILLEAEVYLYMTTPTPASQIHVSTHGANSPVVVGSGSLNQQVHAAEGMAELASAIGSLLELMAQAPRPELAEVREILLEAKEEAAKPAPNRTKLSAILAGSKDAIQTVATLQPAWETAHRFAQALGLLV
jgi:hypothetical protein